MKMSMAGTCAFVIATVIVANACLVDYAAVDGAPLETESVSRSERRVVQQTRVSIVVPTGVDFRRLAASAAGFMLVGDRAQLVTATAGVFAESSANGTTRADYGYDSKVGPITAVGPIRVFDRAEVTGSITSGKDIRFGLKDVTDPVEATVKVTGSINRNATVNAQALAWMVPYDISTRSRTITSGTNSLTPGSYDSVNVQEGTLNLRSGTYYIDRLKLEPNGTIKINATGGPVYVYIRTEFLHKGTWSATAENVLVGYLGTQLLALERTFAGTVVAPNARVRFAVGGAVHSGAVFAKEVEFDPDVRYTFRPFSRWDQLIPEPTVDADCDGAWDVLEATAGLNPADPSDGGTDPDMDGVPTDDELFFGGNPRVADSDGDGVSDSVELSTLTDFDGDGRAYSSDNCPDDGNPDQKDADSDGIGDACDATPMGTDETSLSRLALYRSTSGDAALAPPGLFDTRRARTDLKGLYQTEVTVLGFEAPVGAMRRVDEMWHPSGSHAYVFTENEKKDLKAQGYQEIGSLGYFGRSVPRFGVSVKIRRFSKTISGRVSHAIAVADSGASALISEGFTEIAEIGYGLVDRGSAVRSTLVVRYQDANKRYRYRFSALSEPNVTGWSATGRHFRILAQPSGWTVPLYQLAKPDGPEALALSDEVAGFESQGFVRRGILGYVYPLTGRVEALEQTQILQRVSGTGKETVYTTNLTEIQSLLSGGYTAASPIARVTALRGLDRYRDGGRCTGEQPVVDRIRNAFAGASPLVLAGHTAFALATACTIKRATGTGTVTPGEQNVRSRLAQQDPLIVQTARTESERILQLTAAQRASLLGPLTSLDPGDCSVAVDWRRVGSAVTQTLQGAVPGLNGGTEGGTGQQSLVKMRTPQCQGVTYAAGDRAKAGEAAKAVTASVIGDTRCMGEQCSEPRDYDPRPIPYGVLRGGRGLPAAGSVDQWAAEHGPVGAPLVGIFKSSGCSSCSATLGEACVVPATTTTQECRSYPVVNNNTTVRLSGANLWDLKTARVRLTRVRDGRALPDMDIAGVNVLPVASIAELPARCDPDPVAQRRMIGVTGGLPANPCTPTPGKPCLDPFSRGVQPNEAFVEQIELPISVPDGQVNEFYTVQIVNFNGSYVPRREMVPFDLANLANQGRSIHVCRPPACDPQPSESTAACSLTAMPNCGGGVGGIWNTAPRSLSECAALRDASGDPSFQCEETPFTFVSSPTARDGTPLRIFVAGGQTRYIQTRLNKVHCYGETGWDAAGRDELVVKFGGLSVIPALDIGDLEASVDVYRTSINDGNNRFPEKRFPGVRSDLTETGVSSFLLQAGEDDDIGSAMVTVVVVLTVTGAASGAGAAGTMPVLVAAALGAGAGAGGGVITALLGSANPWFDPEDFIGREGWSANANEIALRGVLNHAPPLDTVPLLTPIPGAQDHVRYRQAGLHAAVDGFAYNTNSEILTCSSSNECAAARPNCVAGACVQSNWTDKTAPIPLDATTDAAGTTEQLRLDGGDGDYKFWISSSVAGRP